MAVVLSKRLLIGVSYEQPYPEAKNPCSQNQQEPWIIARIYTQLESPSKELLDDIVPDRPIALFDSSGHNLLVNSKTLELAGIDSPRHQILSEEKLFEMKMAPTGLLKESAIESSSFHACRSAKHFEHLRERVA